MRITGAVFLSLLAYTVLSAGMILMKKGIAWIGHKGPKDSLWRRDLILWISGFLLSNLYVVPGLMALKTLTPHVVAAFAGFGVVVLILFSQAVLAEPLYRSDVLYTGAVFLAIVVLNVFERAPGKVSLNIPALVGAAAVPPLLFAAAFIKGKERKARAVLFASVSGTATGMIVVLMKVLVDLHGFRVVDYFRSPYAYLYLFFSLGAFVAIQLAYRSATMLRVGPLQYGLSIVYPSACSILVFGNVITPIQVASLSAIVLGIVGILRKHG